LQPASDIMFARIYRKDLAAASFRQFLLDLLQESTVLGMERVFRKIAGLGDDKWNLTSDLRIEFRAVQRPKSVRMIWLQQERIEHCAQHRTVALVFLQRLPNVVFQLAVCLPHRRIHRNAQVRLLFAGSTFVMVSRTPQSCMNELLPVVPHSYPCSFILPASSRNNVLNKSSA
jgi:hypothetical protein